MLIIPGIINDGPNIYVCCQTKVHNCNCNYLLLYFIVLLSKILLLIEFCFIISLIFLIFSPCPKYTSLGVRLSNDSCYNIAPTHLYVVKQKCTTANRVT